jgi:head-tail adaptor
MVRAGLLDQRVTFYRQTRTTDTQKGASLAWAAISGLSSVPVRFESVNGDGSESLQADQVTATQRWRVTSRYSTTLATVTPKDRLLWGTRILQIDAARPAGQRLREVIEFACSERTS